MWCAAALARRGGCWRRSPAAPSAVDAASRGRRRPAAEPPRGAPPTVPGGESAGRLLRLDRARPDRRAAGCAATSRRPTRPSASTTWCATSSGSRSTTNMPTSAAGSSAASSPALLRRWDRPVRVAVMTGPSAPAEDAARDRANVAAFTRRLARLTGLDMALGRGAGRELPRAVHDQRRAHRLRRPGRAALSRLRARGDAARCATRRSTPSAPPMPSPTRRSPSVYSAVIILIRAEHPPLTRLSLRARGDGAGDGAAERQPGRAAVAVQRQPASSRS